ncbi:MAG: enoyl-CoA hydratase-related protein [Steroidobacteraceae bacterium]|jgi:methylglutaconyl-CoA hydratase|nr:enoyl-CoA hydratase-related protein [Steroidobacteraceae bacterium]
MDGENLVLLDHDARGVATITLNRPERHNALSAALIGELTEVLVQLQEDNSVRVVVLASAGPTFCAGADIEEMRRAAGASAAENERDARRLANLLVLLDGLAHPVVARVQGHGFGGALGLIAACDIVVAADGAQFALTEVRLGIVPAMISPFVLRAIGARQARRFFLTAERFDATAAERLGLVHQIVPVETLDAAVAGIVGELLKGAPGAQADAKRLIRYITGRSDGQDREFAVETANWIARLRALGEGREGLGAFLERRAPAWRRD